MQIEICCLLTLFNVVLAFQMPKGALNQNGGKNWAVLIAGSKGWDNYRHQADVAHAYAILTKNGIPADQIIMMAYDDIAYNIQNPFPGQIFNNYNHNNVYDSSAVDYKGMDINVATIEKVMLGDQDFKAKGKKVLDSGPKDNIFFYYSDHGGEGVLALPHSAWFAQDINKLLREMFKAKKYHEMVIYIEACHSGSLFTLYPPNELKVYVTTAAKPEENSYSSHCADRKIKTCLGDEYSSAWMEDTSSTNITKRSLNGQYTKVKSLVKMSHVCRYGDYKIAKESVANFQGSGVYSYKQMKPKQAFQATLGNQHKVASSRSHIHSRLRASLEAKTDDKRKLAERKLHRSIQLAKFVEQIFEDILADVEKRLMVLHKNVSVDQRMDCVKTVFEVFQAHCFEAHQVPELMEHVSKLHKMCQAGYNPDHLVQSVLHVCT